MPSLKINHEKITTDIAHILVNICPFSAIQFANPEKSKIEITSACKMCKICVNRGPKGAVEFVEEEEKQVQIDKSLWDGILVFIEHIDGTIHPVCYELIAKARSLASVGHQNVYCLLIGNHCKSLAKELLLYGVDKVYCYEDKVLEHFQLIPYTNCFEDLINTLKPSSILVGATHLGRSLAPRVAARFRTGLTADCTILDVKENTDLIQIRPAFGGNIMAQIITPNHRPQFCTVRYKIFDAAPKQETSTGEIISMEIEETKKASTTEVLEIIKKTIEVDISEAEVIVAVGRGFKSKKDLQLAYDLAALLDAQIACTRPLAEAGWFESRYQIGLSGRTVKPKLIITLGISGAIQFVAGMNSAECIIAINPDANAAIFDIAHYAFVGDMYEIVPQLIEKVKQRSPL